jgi:hypothetical protein
LIITTSVLFSQKTTIIVREIAKCNRYESQFVGFSGSPSAQFKRFEKLKIIAEVQELLKLANEHGNAVVRLYAYDALIEKKEKIPPELKSKLSKDKTVVSTLNGCIGGEKNVGEIILSKH